MKIFNFSAFTIGLVLLTGTFGCRKFINQGLPATIITSESVYSTNSGAAAAMTSVYEKIIETATIASGTNSIGYLTSLSGDELQLYYQGDQVQQGAYANSLSSANYPLFWQFLYTQLHVVNVVISNVANSKGVSEHEKEQLTGEAKFMRAFLLHYATLLYGDVPIVTSGDFQVTSKLKRLPVADVNKQITQDLLDAQKLLPVNYVDPLGNPAAERVRPNQAAATALLARVYLYQGKWAEAETEANKVIADSRFLLDRNLTNVFLTTSKEAIWQLQTAAPANSVDTYDGYIYVLTSEPGSGNYPSALSTFQVEAFEPGDLRFRDWVGQFSSGGVTYYYPNKYKVGIYHSGDPIPEYTTVFRLAELYLIRAEARAHLNKLTGAGSAQEDLNAIRSRAGLSVTMASSQQDLLAAILKERRVELFTEWGHRWFDLKRTGNLDIVMDTVAPVKQGSWSSYKYLYPIPQMEITADHNLTQTPGYN